MSELTSLSAELPPSERAAGASPRGRRTGVGGRPAGSGHPGGGGLQTIDASFLQRTASSIRTPLTDDGAATAPCALALPPAHVALPALEHTTRAGAVLLLESTSSLRQAPRGPHGSCSDAPRGTGATAEGASQLGAVETAAASSEAGSVVSAPASAAQEAIQLGGQFARGQVKHVHHATWNSVPVAVLLMDGEALAHESAILEALERPHPNIVQFYGCYKLQGRNCLVMEAAEYGSLDTLLRRCRAEGYMFTTAAKVSMGLQVCAALAELASLSILHGDMAARNVLVTRMHPIHVKICDFGLAQRVGEGGTACAPAPAALVPLRWLPPECLGADPKWSPASDIWAFGTLFMIPSSHSDAPPGCCSLARLACARPLHPSRP